MKYLRNRNDGFIYPWNEYLAVNPLCEEISEEQAFPERFEPKAAKGRKPKVNLATEDAVEAPQSDPMIDLNDELTRKTQV